jgi:hypothetical protein
LLAQGKTTVAFETIENGANTNGNFGPGLRAELILAFEAVNKQLQGDKKEFVTIADNAAFKVRGSYSIEDDRNDGGSPKRQRLLAVEVNIEITDGTEKQSDLTFFLTRGRDIVAAEGLSIKLDPDAGKKDQHKEIRKALDALESGGDDAKPMFVVEGTKIKTNKDSEYAIELVTRSPVGTKYSPRGPKSDSGALPFVPVGVGEIYGIKIYNKSDRRISVAMKIDGIDQFTFSEERNEKTARPRFTSWIVGAKSSFTIKGWHISADNSRKDNLSAFQVTKYGEGASKFAKSVDQNLNGVISVAIATEFVSGSRGDSETGFGPPVEQKQKVVKVKMNPPHEFLSIRYSR